MRGIMLLWLEGIEGPLHYLYAEHRTAVRVAWRGWPTGFRQNPRLLLSLLAYTHHASEGAVRVKMI